VKDTHSRRGPFEARVAAVASSLDYLKRADEGRYKTLIEKLGIRR